MTVLSLMAQTVSKMMVLRILFRSRGLMVWSLNMENQQLLVDALRLAFALQEANLTNSSSYMLGQ